MQLHNGIWVWSMRPSTYIKEAVRICNEYVAKHLSKDYKLPKRADNPSKIYYWHELNVSPILGPDEASYDQFLIAVMRWMIEIAHIDINIKVTLLTSHSAMPKQGHLEAMLHIMGYL